MVTPADVKKNSLVIAAVFCAAFFYLPAVLSKRPVPIRGTAFHSLISPTAISCLEGTVLSSPAKTTNGTYRITFSPERAFSKDGAQSETRGTITVYIRASEIEVYYPGKAYTALKSDAEESPALIDSGARLSITGNMHANGAFYADEIRAKGWRKHLAGRIDRFRAHCRLYFRRLMYSWGEAGGFVLALLSGSREYLDSTVASAFIAAGLAHILALSGMHITAFMTFTRSIESRFMHTATFRALLFQLLTVLFFVWFAGSSPSLIRALFCSLLLMCCSLCHVRSPRFLSILAASFLLQTACFPQHIYQPAFLLSYTALLGITILAPFFKRIFSRILFPALAESCATSAGAQLATMPLCAVFFSKVAVFGAAASVIVAPIVICFLYLALIGIILSLAFPFLSPAIRAMIQAVYALIKLFVLFFARFPAVTIR